MGERIIDYPEAETLANDDYILLDGITGGSKKILASELGGGGGGGSKTPEIQYIFNSAQTGEETFTITENGKYLIVVSYSYNGSGSITLPSGRTPEIDESFLGNDARGFKVVIANLTAGDIVTMSNTVGDHTARAKCILKLNNISDLTTKTDSNVQNDSTVSPTVYATGKTLFIGLCCGRLGGNYYDYSRDYGGEIYAGVIGENTLIRVVYTNDTLTIPVYLYGYDGGYGGFAVFE